MTTQLPATYCGKTAEEWAQQCASQAVKILRLRQACKDGISRWNTVQKYFEDNVNDHAAAHCGDIIEIMHSALEATKGIE